MTAAQPTCAQDAASRPHAGVSAATWALPLLLAMCVPASVWGQAAPTSPPATAAKSKPAPPPNTSDEDEEEETSTTVRGITVTAHKKIPYSQQPGAVVGDIEPEEQFTPADIQSFGVSTLNELLTELAPEARSDRGRGGSSPVVLLNGRRISGFNEIQNIPAEAILRIDILPEEVSLKYGYTADQRVINVVLRRRFRAITGELVGGGPTEGGQETGQAEGDLLHIRGDNRLNLDLKYTGQSNLTEADRDIDAPDTADRTLLPATQAVTANTVLARPIFWDIRATGNLTLGATRSDALQGLPGEGSVLPTGDPTSATDAPAGLSPLRQEIDGWTAHLGSTLNKDLPKWRLSLTDAYDHADTQTDTDTGLETGLAQTNARSISDTLNIQFLGNGPVVNLPAGALYASVKVGDTQTWQDSTALQIGSFEAVDLARNDANAQLNLDLPLTSDDHHVLAAVGDLSANLNLAADQLSDFGFLPTLGYGLNWTPVEGVNLIVSRTHDHAAPTVAQLGAPVVLTPGVRLFDYTTGQTVDVTQITGGEQGLKADTRDVTKVGLTLKPFDKPTFTFTFTANYIDSRIKNATTTFPAADAGIEAAFPERFIRDDDGDLVEEDERPINLESEARQELRYGFVFSRPLGPQPPPRTFRRRPRPPQGADASNPPENANASRAEGGSAPPDAPGAPPPASAGADGGGGGGRRGGGGFGGGRSGFGPGGRLQIAVYHTVFFRDQEVLRTGVAPLDLLNGASAGATGGQPQQEIEAQLGATLFGFGARLSADWKSATTVNSSLASSTGDLNFSSIGTINLRLFDNIGQQPPAVRHFPWLRGARVTVAAVNLFDQRIRVRDAAGATPLIYQPAYLNPAGRTISISLRKLFF